MAVEDEELDPLWAKLERNAFVAEEGDDEDELAEGFSQNETPEKEGANRGQPEEVGLRSEYIKWGIDMI